MLGKCLNPQKINGFHERIAKELLKFFEKHVYIPKSIIWKSWESAGNWIYTWVDNRKVSVPHFKNRPILVFSTERKNLQPFTLTKKKKHWLEILYVVRLCLKGKKTTILWIPYNGNNWKHSPCRFQIASSWNL